MESAIPNFQPKRGRGRPKKILTPEEILALKNKPIRGRGRPKKIKTQAEILAELNRPKLGRGRPKKERTPEELAKLNAPKRPRGRPKKDSASLADREQNIILSETQKITKKTYTPPMDLEDMLSKVVEPELIERTEIEQDFIFPIYEKPAKGGELTKSIEEKIISKPVEKPEIKPTQSPHLVNLKKSEKKLEQPTPQQNPFNYPQFNPEDWFSNLNYNPYLNPYYNPYQNISPRNTRQVDEVISQMNNESFAPNEIVNEIHFNKPVKIKKDSIKFDFKSDLPNIKKTRARKISSPIFNPLKMLWALIVLPFKILDFIVDRTFKFIGKFVYFVFKNLFNLFKNTGKNFVLIFKTRQPAMQRVSVQTNLKPLVSFTIICLLIIIPLQLLSLKQKNEHIQSQVLGKSIEAVNLLQSGAELSGQLDFTSASQNFNQAYFNFKLAENHLDNLDAFSSHLVKILPQTSQADDLLLIGQLAAKVGTNLTSALTDFSAEENFILKLEKINSSITDNEPYLLELIDKINNLDLQALSKIISEEQIAQLKKLQNNLELIQNNFSNLKELNSFLLTFFGQSTPKKYLVIFQNNSELRPTGGFMGSYALVEIKNGEIVNLDVPGGGFYDLKAANATLVEAPKPFHLFSPYWQIWNANWFADWPTSAEKISWFYEHMLNGETVDGVLTLTPDVIEDLLNIFGPIDLPDYNKQLTAENFVTEVQMAVEVEYDKEVNQPKQIIGDLMPIILDNIFNLKTEQVPEFLTLLNNNLNTKNILMWFSDEQMEDTIDKFGWHGKIKQNVPQDYLMVVHTNIGGGKTDAVIDNKIQHSVEVNSAGELIDTVTLTKKHNGTPGNIFEDQNNVDYVRFYVPTGSQLISAEGFDYLPANIFKIAENYKTLQPDPTLEQVEQNSILDEKTNTRITQEFGKTCFGNWMQIKTGEEKTVTLKYKLPFTLNLPKENFLQKITAFVGLEKKPTLNYSLYVQKQPGVNSTDFASEIKLPNNLTITSSLKKDKDDNILNAIPNSAIYSDPLETDGYYRLEIE